MDREKFVGIIIEIALEGEEPVEHILSKFVGEGNSAIVFGVAPLSDPEGGKWVVKFFKPDVRFEMTVLHYSFRIAEKLFPNHPLLMAPAERMSRLTEEMLGRIESDGSLFRLLAFRDMLRATIELLGRQFAERFLAGTLPADWLSEVGAGILSLFDDSLVLTIESALEDEAFTDEAQPFFEKILGDIREEVAAAKKKGSFHPLSRNRLFKLLGLHLENFINWDELLAITDSDSFRLALAPDEVADFANAGSILYYRASSKKKIPEQSSEDDRSMADAEYKEILPAAKAAARYMDAVAVKYHPGLPHFSAFAKNWYARTLLLEGKRDEAVALFQEVLGLPLTNKSLLERHDALLDLSELLAASEPKRARQYASEALKLRQTLEKA